MPIVKTAKSRLVQQAKTIPKEKGAEEYDF